jgi:hypothetical protein
MGSDSDDDDDTAGLQAQMAQMLGPMNKKLTKAVKKVDKLEMAIDQVRKLAEEQLPAIRKEMTSSSTDASVRLERLQSEVATLASKTTMEVVRQEGAAMEQRLRQALDDQRSKTTAMELIVQGLEARIDSMERTARATDLKVGSELSAAVSQLGQLNATVERQRGEFEALVGEQRARVGTMHDGILTRMGAFEEQHRELQGSLASKAELAELAATVARRAGEAEESMKVSAEQCRISQQAVEALKAALASYATVSALEKLDARAESIGAETRQMLARHGESSASERAAWEDKLIQRQHGIEAAANEARRDWHRLAAQLEQLQTYVTERALLSEHEELSAAVQTLRAESASKAELLAVEDMARAAAGGAAFAAVQESVRSLEAGARAAEEQYGERFSRTADLASFSALEERVVNLTTQLDGKMGASEGRFALDSKLEKALGEQLAAEIEAIQKRITSLLERSGEAELAASSATSSSHSTSNQLSLVKEQQEELSRMHESVLAETRACESNVHDLIKAVRALTHDAEMRAALDEREIEFLWAAPAQIYGAHGWRANNGSKSERTPYPVGNFKMAVRHGTEGNARDVLAARKRWLNSITFGKREVCCAGCRPIQGSPDL